MYYTIILVLLVGCGGGVLPQGDAATEDSDAHGSDGSTLVPDAGDPVQDGDTGTDAGIRRDGEADAMAVPDSDAGTPDGAAPGTDAGTPDAGSTTAPGTPIAVTPWSTGFCALDDLHHVWCWGNDQDVTLVEGLVATEISGNCGKQPDGHVLCQDPITGTLMTVVRDDGVDLVATGLGVQVGSARFRGCAETGGSDIWCWAGQTAGTPDYTAHRRASGFTPAVVTYVDAGNDSYCYQGVDNNFWCWGVITGTTTPVQINTRPATDVVVDMAVSTTAGAAVWTLLTAHGYEQELGGVPPYTWYAGGYSNIAGDGVSLNPGTHTSVGPYTGIVVDTAMSHGATCVVTPDGITCWGDNTHKQLGDTTTASRPTPGPVSW